MSVLGSSSTCEDVVKDLPAGVQAVQGSTVIVTGASAGIGEETAFQLAVLGASVVCAVRNVVKGEAAVANMRKRAGSAGAALSLRVLRLDTSELSSVPAFVEAFQEESKSADLPPLRYLINNAGIATYPEGKTTSSQGHDLIFDTNHLGHFALTNALLPILRENSPSRIVLISSDSHYNPAVTEESLSSVEKLQAAVVVPKQSMGLIGTMKVYGDSKLLNVLHAQALHARETANGVTTTVLHPGNAITTSIFDTAGAFVRFMFKYVIAVFTKSVNQGTSTTMYCTLADADKVAGLYFSNCNAKEVSKLVTKEAAEIMWALSQDLVTAKL